MDRVLEHDPQVPVVCKDEPEGPEQEQVTGSCHRSCATRQL